MKTIQNPSLVKNPNQSMTNVFWPFSLALVVALYLSLLAIMLFCSPAQATEPIDLAKLASQGLSEKSREIIVTQSLAHRARPPLEIEFIQSLATYGGDALALAYLEMDANTANQESSPLPPASMKNMMAAGLSPLDLIKFSQSVNPGLTQNNDSAALVGVSTGPMVTAMTVAANTEGPVEYPVSPTEPPTPATPSTTATPFYHENTGPERPVTPKVSFMKPKDLRNVPQTLSPGQQADPARPLPEAPGPYWTRAPRGHETFLGVTQQVKADGHRYEVNTNARGGRLGQEVLSRASGHKVVRYYSTNPKRSQAAPAPNNFGRNYGDVNGGEDYGEYAYAEEDYSDNSENSYYYE